LTPYVVEEVLGVGESKLSGVRLRNTETGESLDSPTDGLFVAIGHDPTTALFVDQLDHDEAGYLVTKGKTTETNIPGVFAAGGPLATARPARRRARAAPPTSGRRFFPPPGGRRPPRR